MRVWGLEQLAFVIFFSTYLSAKWVYDRLIGPFERLWHWGKKKSKESIIFLLATIIGVSLLAITLVVSYTLMVTLSFIGMIAVPLLYALMVIVKKPQPT